MLDTLFLKVLDMTAKGSLVILAVILVRLLLKKAPKIFSYTLWGVVLLRLLCPFSIQLPVSVLPEMESATETYRFESDPITVIDAGNAVTHVIGEASSGNLNTEQIYVDVPSALGGSRPMAATLWEICIMAGQYLWLMGMLAVLLHSLTHYFLLRKKLIGAMHLQGNIWLADHIPSPFVMGIIKPRIYLPATLQERELEYIIAHEQHHIRRGDHIVKLLAFIALAMHWFNPLVWLAYLLFCKDMEMSCDEAVVKKLGVGIRADYAASLLRFATGRRIASTSPLAFGEGDTKSRIQNLAKWKKPVGWILKVCALVCAVTVVCLLADPTPRAGNVTGSTDPKTETTQPGGVAVTEGFDIVLAHAGYTADVAFYAAAENSDRFHLSSALHLPIYKFDTKGQLDDFTGTYGKFLSLNQSYDEVPSFYGVAQRYDEAFFNENTLMIVYISASSGSYRYGVREIYCADHYFCIHVEKTKDPQVHTDDMAGWFLMVSVPDSMVSDIKSFDADLDVPSAEGGHAPSLQVKVDNVSGNKHFSGFVRKTNFFGISQKVKAAVADEWTAYDMLTPNQRMYSNRVFGEITLRANTWQEMETDLGIQIENPLLDVSWITPTDVYGGVATSDAILHTQANIYATDADTREVEQITVSAGYRGDGQRVVLEATVFGVHTLFTSNMGDAQLQGETNQTGSGMAVHIISEGDEKYTVVEAIWIDQDTYYKLRVIGEPGQASQISDVLQKLLQEI